MIYFHLTLKSDNAKTGPIPVSTSSRETCGDCVFKGKGGCYGENYPIKYHWNKVSNGQRGIEYKEFISQIKKLPDNQFWRHNQIGDLPGKGNRINGKQLNSLVKANSGKRGFSYTHKPVLGNSFVAKQNRKHIKASNQNGLTINLSGNNLNHADKLKKLNIGPVVVVLPLGSPNTVFTPAGNKVIVCPAQQKDTTVTCKSCQLCQKTNRSVIVGFISHGVAKNKVNLVAQAS